MTSLTTRPISTPEQLVAHFDRIAPAYEDTHGPAQRLLAYRLSVITGLLRSPRIGTLLEIGCGKAVHLIGLAGRCDRALGTDVSREMVRMARIGADRSPWRDRIELRVDPAEELATVPDESVDVVLCVGALEHMLDRPRALSQVRRVLRPAGRFVCLTPNGEYLWYRAVAPRLGLDTRHLSTDRFLRADELDALARAAVLEPERLEHWRFIPKGDMPRVWGHVLHGLDLPGRLVAARWLRGGLAFLAVRGR